MRTSAIARLIVMGVLLIALLLPLSMVQSVVSERASRRGTQRRQHLAALDQSAGHLFCGLLEQ